MKQILALITGVVMLFGLFGCGSAVSGNNNTKQDTAGTCGDNITWEYDKRSKTLTISGTGDMIDVEKFAWSDYKINKLIISEGITSVANNAFYSNHNLKGELVLPESLKKIGDFAFYGCDSLTGELIIPDGVETVGAYAFTRASGFSGLHLSNSLKIARRP